MTSKLIVDSIEGRTGKGFLTPDRPSFRAGMTADDSANHTTEAIIEFNSVSSSVLGHDSAGGFNTSTYKYTIPTTGIYYIGINLRASSLTDASYHIVRLYKNGSEQANTKCIEDPQGGNQGMLHYSGIFSFSSSDVIHWTYQVSGDTSSQIDSGGTSFEGFLIG